MFLFTKSSLKQSEDLRVKCQITDEEGNIYEVLRINQYESRFQSMSVMIRDKQADKIYIFSKGAP